MRRMLGRGLILAGGLIAAPSLSLAQTEGPPYFKADTGAPGDAMIQASLSRQAKESDAKYAEDTALSAEQWAERRPQYVREYLYMQGLDPLPERTPLQATVVGTLPRDGYLVDRMHYQSRPGLYVTANLYRPENIKPGARLPAILYVMGHTDMGRNGHKTAYAQTHAIWYAKHGYICLTVDTLQRGEIRDKDKDLHHGTYSQNRAWWVSAGYTPAGVEFWNGTRGIDYLVSRPDVDPERIGMTGISGGGIVTTWVAAADERVKAAAQVSGVSDLEDYIGQFTLKGHCDCSFVYNTYQWPWTRLAGLIAPRPYFFINSDNDRLFLMDGNERISNRLERFYSRFGAGDKFETLVSVGLHSYRDDIRRSIFEFFNRHLKNDCAPVADFDVGQARLEGEERVYLIPPEELRVFTTDADIPADQINTTVDEKFVARGVVPAPEPAEADTWRANLLGRLREFTFRPFPERIPPAHRVDGSEDETVRIETEQGIILPLKRLAGSGEGREIVLQIGEIGESGQNAARGTVYQLDPRGTGATRWTRQNPPNYVERCLPLLGQTADGGRVRDVIAAARYLKVRHKDANLTVVGKDSLGLVGAYAAVLEPEIDAVVAINPASTHMDASAPQLLNVLRVLDVPQALALIAPRPLVLVGSDEALSKTVADLYARQNAAGKVEVR